jgi:hypothetical protein
MASGFVAYFLKRKRKITPDDTSLPFQLVNELEIRSFGRADTLFSPAKRC